MKTWQCPECNETHEPQFDNCWKCARLEDHKPGNRRRQPLFTLSGFSWRRCVLIILMSGLLYTVAYGALCSRQITCRIASTAGLFAFPNRVAAYSFFPLVLYEHQSQGITGSLVVISPVPVEHPSFHRSLEVDDMVFFLRSEGSQ